MKTWGVRMDVMGAGGVRASELHSRRLVSCVCVCVCYTASGTGHWIWTCLFSLLAHSHPKRAKGSEVRSGEKNPNTSSGYFFPSPSGLINILLFF